MERVRGWAGGINTQGRGNGSAKTDPVRFKWAFGEGLLKDKFIFFEASKNPIPKRRQLRPFL